MKYYAMRLGIWIVYPALFAGIIIFCFITCSNNNKIGSKNIQNDSVQSKKEFSMVTIPSNLTSPNDRAYYLVSHYWDNFDFNDTTYMHLPQITEQAFANYIEILPHTQKETAYISIKTMLSKAEEEPTGKMYPYFLDLYKKYLHDPNSPLRNEEFYIPVADHIINDKISTETEKERATFNLKMMNKNRVGRNATDFTYTLASGHTEQLFDVKANYTLVYFNNPDCKACEEIILYMKHSSLISSLVENGTLMILAVYPDKDISIWKKHLKNIPSTWINGYDKHTVINDKLLYDLKAIPTIYLLDKDKKVLLKDANVQQVEDILKNNLAPLR